MRTKHARIIRAAIIAARNHKDETQIHTAQEFVKVASIADVDLFMRAYFRARS
jgi:hypothetical protein